MSKCGESWFFHSYNAYGRSNVEVGRGISIRIVKSVEEKHADAPQDSRLKLAIVGMSRRI